MKYFFIGLLGLAACISPVDSQVFAEKQNSKDVQEEFLILPSNGPDPCAPYYQKVLFHDSSIAISVPTNCIPFNTDKGDPLLDLSDPEEEISNTPDPEIPNPSQMENAE